MEYLLHNKWSGIVFTLIIFAAAWISWYRICVKNGAEGWSRSIIEYYNKIGSGFIGRSFLYRPTTLKIVYTVAIISLTIGLYFAMRNLFGDP
jgi:hypothetical protein